MFFDYIVYIYWTNLLWSYKENTIECSVYKDFNYNHALFILKIMISLNEYLSPGWYGYESVPNIPRIKVPDYDKTASDRSG